MAQFCNDDCGVADAGQSDLGPFDVQDTGATTDAMAGDAMIKDAAAEDAGEPDSAFEDVGPPRDTGPDAICGNSILEPDEECDDGDVAPGDGCDDVCSVEPNYRCFNPGEDCIPWWLDGLARIKLDVGAGASDVPAGFATSVTFDHAAVQQRYPQAADRVHLIRHLVNGSLVQVDRYLDPVSSWGSATTRVWFKVEDSVAAQANDDTYYLYFGANPPSTSQDPRAIFRFFDDFESGRSPEWTGTDGPSPLIEPRTAPWDANNDALFASDVGGDEIARSTWSRDVPLDPNTNDYPDNRALTLFIQLPQLLTFPNRNWVVFSNYCGTNCTPFPNPGQIAGIAVQAVTGAHEPFIEFRGGEILSFLLGQTLTIGTWHRIELKLRYDQLAGTVTARLILDDAFVVQSNPVTHGNGLLRKAHVGVFANELGDAQVYIDNTWERDFLDDEPTVVPGQVYP